MEDDGGGDGGNTAPVVSQSHLPAVTPPKTLFT